jgi:hypothetical protein
MRVKHFFAAACVNSQSNPVCYIRSSGVSSDEPTRDDAKNICLGPCRIYDRL